MFAPLLVGGVLLGMKHALEADHVAAVAALATRSSSVAERVKLATMWGVGHAGTLVAVGGVLLALGLSLPPALARLFESAVGVMLIVLGVGVLRRLRARRIHFHAHRHDDGRVHFHAHAHGAAVAHDAAAHAHEHPTRLLPRALLVGSMHGLAGSAALVLIALEGTRSSLQALGGLALFGLGAVIGMVALSLVISVPLRVSSARLGAADRGLEAALGVLTVLLGTWIALGHTFAE